MATLFSFFKEYPQFSMLAAPIYIPTLQEGSLFLILSPAFVICRLFNDSHCEWCVVTPHCRFYLHFSNNAEYLFMCLLIYLYIFFGKKVSLELLSIKKKKNSVFGCTRSSLLCTGFLQLQQLGATLHCGSRFSLWWLLLMQSAGSRCAGFNIFFGNSGSFMVPY